MGSPHENAFVGQNSVWPPQLAAGCRRVQVVRLAMVRPRPEWGRHAVIDVITAWAARGVT